MMYEGQIYNPAKESQIISMCLEPHFQPFIINRCLDMFGDFQPFPNISYVKIG